MKRFLTYFIFFAFILSNYFSFGQSLYCIGADPFCGDQQYTFPAGTGLPDAETGPYYDCLSTTPNPAWYFMQVGNAGPITITMTGLSPSFPPVPRDIDFICWGPFTSPTGPCPTPTGECGLTQVMVVACSYSPSNIETFTIPNAQPYEFYMLMITNFSNQPTNITFSQTNYYEP